MARLRHFRRSPLPETARPGADFAEEFRINNTYLEQRANIDFEILHREGEQHLKEKREVVERWMISQAIKLKEGDTSLKAAVNELYALLDNKDVK